MEQKILTAGDPVQLKIPEQGRRFAGRIVKSVGDSFHVGLPNGLYVIRPKELWELRDESSSSSENKEATDEVK